MSVRPTLRLRRAVGWAALALVGCTGRAPAPVATYVGREACATCHAEEVTAWRGSHHDLAMQPATDGTVLGDFDGATFTHSDVTTTFFRNGERFLVRTEGRDGSLADFEVSYTFGFDPLQQYVVTFPGGRYQMLGIAWDSRAASEGGQRWFHLYPDVDTGPSSRLHWTRPSQNWNTVCAECHTTNLDKGFDVEAGSFTTTWSEIDVSCEACHGPASRHVELAAERGSRWSSDPAAGRDGYEDADRGLVVHLGDPGRSWGIGPGATTATRAGAATTVAGDPARAQVEACAACHARRAAVTDPRNPADGLFAAYAPSLLREDLYYPDGQIREEVYVYGSFVQSKMYAAGVTCSDCHEPHSLRTRAEGNTLCGRCHQPATYDTASHHHHEASSEGARCVECHMPETTYMVVDRRRDHSIRVPRPDLTDSLGTPNACNRCHADRTASWAAERFAAWYPGRAAAPHYGTVLAAGRRHDPAAAPELVALARDTLQPAIVRGTAVDLLAAYSAGRALPVVREALASSEPMLRVGAAQALASMDPRAAAPLALGAFEDSTAAVRYFAARAAAMFPPERVSARTRMALDSVIGTYELLERVNEDHSSSWVALGDAYALRQRFADAQLAYGTALALDSTDLVASLNLADLLRSVGRDDLAERTLEGALRYEPDAAELLHSFGLLRIRQARGAEAVALLREAADAAPENPRFAYVYGVAVASDGDLVGGIRVLEQALERHPFDVDLLCGLVAYYRQRGDVATALEYAERLRDVAPDDPDVGALVERLRGEAR